MNVHPNVYILSVISHIHMLCNLAIDTAPAGNTYSYNLSSGTMSHIA
jgi:hypothetical protein